LFRIYLANKIGSEALGIYQIAFSIFIVFATAVASGLPLTLSKLTAKYRLNKEIKSESNAVSAALVLGLALSTFICLMLLIFKASITKILTNELAFTSLLILSPAVIFTAIFGAFKGSLWGQQKHLVLSINDLVEQILRIIFAVILIDFALFGFSGVIAASLALTVSCLFSAVLAGFYYFKYKGRLVVPKKDTYAPLLKSSLPITGVRAASSLIQPLIAILVPLRLIASGYTEAQALSELGIALGMTFPLLFLPITIVGALSIALIPELSTLIEQNNKKELLKRINSSLLFSLFFAFLFIPLYIGLGVPIGKFLFNNSTSGIYLAQAAFIMVPLSLSAITASILNALNLEVKSFSNYLIGSFMLILSLWVLPEYIGVRALIFGMALCMCVITILNLKMINLKTKINNQLLRPTVFMSIFIIPSSLISTYTYNLFTLFFPKFLCIMLAGGLGALMFILLCLVFNIINLDLWFLSLRKTALLKLNKKQKLA
jgi:stage V sporulation protein B